MNFCIRAEHACHTVLEFTQEDHLQHTISNIVTRSGVGLHSGKEATVRLIPYNAGKGRFFSYKDEKIPATAKFVVATRLSTCIGRGSTKICTVEHLLSALECTGIDNCLIELKGNDEIPLLDGSAVEWVEAIEEAGICIARDEHGNSLPRRRLKLNQPVHVYDSDSFVAYFPAQNSKLTYGIEFSEYEAIGRQWFTWCPDSSTYKTAVAPARTFGLEEQISALREAGLIKGGTLNNALVCSMKSGWLNPPLRFIDEPCRHKLVDLIGDVSLCCEDGNPGLPVGHVIAFKASHSLHVKFCQALLKIKHNDDEYLLEYSPQYNEYTPA